MGLGSRLYDWCPRSLVTPFPTVFFRYQQLLHGKPPWRCRGTRLRALATIPPSTSLRRRYLPRRAAGVAGGRPRVGRATCSRPHAPPDPVGHTPLSHTCRLGGTPVQHRRQPRPGSQPHFRHLSCSPARSCESTGLGDDGQLLGEGGNGSGSRRCAHEVWWVPACVGSS
jgi:hypothetical protein